MTAPKTQVKAKCIGTALSQLEAIFLIWSDGAQGRDQAAWAALTNGIELLTIGQVQQRLATQGIEIAADAVADLQAEAVRRGPSGVIAIFQPDNKQARAPVDVGDCANAHSTILQQSGME